MNTLNFKKQKRNKLIHIFTLMATLAVLAYAMGSSLGQPLTVLDMLLISVLSINAGVDISYLFDIKNKQDQI